MDSAVNLTLSSYYSLLLGKLFIGSYLTGFAKKTFSKEIVCTTKYKMRRTGMVEKDEQILDILEELAKETMAVLSTYNGTITPSHTISVQKLYTYPSPAPADTQNTQDSGTRL